MPPGIGAKPAAAAATVGSMPIAGLTLGSESSSGTVVASETALAPAAAWEAGSTLCCSCPVEGVSAGGSAGVWLFLALMMTRCGRVKGE
jgi:hypothetical protein